MSMMKANGFDFRKLAFRSPEAHDRQWLEWYLEEFNRFFIKVDLTVDSSKEFTFGSVVRTLPGLSICHALSSPSSCRNLAHLADNDDITFMIGGDGAATVEVAGEQRVLERGSAILTVSDVPSAVHVTDKARLTIFQISRKLLEPVLPRSIDLAGAAIPADVQGLRLLVSYIRSLDGEDRLDTPEDGHLVTTHLRDLAAMAIGPTRLGLHEARQGGARAARLAAIKADILSNLTNDLSIDTLAARHGVTPRYIGSLFAGAETTYTDFVLENRLAHAHQMLRDPRHAHLIISSIALDSGFGDLSYFNRCFRRRFGMTPSDVRQLAREGA